MCVLPLLLLLGILFPPFSIPPCLIKVRTSSSGSRASVVAAAAAKREKSSLFPVLLFSSSSSPCSHSVRAPPRLKREGERKGIRKKQRIMTGIVEIECGANGCCFGKTNRVVIAYNFAFNLACGKSVKAFSTLPPQPTERYLWCDFLHLLPFFVLDGFVQVSEAI